MIKAVLEKVFGAYLPLIEVAVILGGAWWAYEHVKQIGWDANEARHVELEKKDADLRKAELDAANADRDAARSALAEYRANNPVGAVRLCVPSRPPVQAAGVPAGTTSTISGPIQRVPEGDSSSGPQRAGVDIGGMLEAIVASADTVSDDLRRRQQVRH